MGYSAVDPQKRPKKKLVAVRGRGGVDCKILRGEASKPGSVPGCKGKDVECGGKDEDERLLL